MQSRAFRRFSAAPAGLVTACQASSIRRFLPSASAALLSSVSARLVSATCSNRLSAARLVCTFPTRAVLTGASALDQCRARVRARSRRRSDTRNYRTTGLQSIELAVTTPSSRCFLTTAVVQSMNPLASRDFKRQAPWNEGLGVLAKRTITIPIVHQSSPE